MPNWGLGRSLFSWVGAYAFFVLGFWLLFQAFDRPSPGLGILGGIVILVAMYMMAGFRRHGFGSFSQTDDADSGDMAPDRTSAESSGNDRSSQ